MPTAWVAAPQDTLLDQVAATLDGPQRSGVALVGADGVGKTLVARRAAEKFAVAAPSTVVRWVAGTATERVIPFGAFRALLYNAEIADAGRPAELLR
ncbi:MAG: AAA family ATPase, partial [Mycobacterium sp.]